jgi:UTP:GlnB (protein PII) uridylyltransferase
MKAHMNFSMDFDIAKLLEFEPNKSALVNRLLRAYFQERESKEIKDTIPKEIEEVLNAESANLS